MKNMNIISLVTRFNKAALVAVLALPIVYGDANAQVIDMTSSPTPESIIGLTYTPKSTAAAPFYTCGIVNVTGCTDFGTNTSITYTYSYTYTTPPTPPATGNSYNDIVNQPTAGNYPGKTCATLKTTPIADMLKMPAGPTACPITKISY